MSAFELDLTVNDGRSNVPLKIGMRADATDLRDRGIDRSAPPPPPDDYLQAHIAGGGGDLFWDFRALTADTVRYILVIDPAAVTDDPVIRWDDMVDLATLGSFRIKNRLPPPFQQAFDVDMTQIDSLDTAGPPDLTQGVVIEVVRSEPGVTLLLIVEVSFDAIAQCE